MSFKTSKLLLKHYRLHTDDFPYKCWTCGEGFRDKYSKLKHSEKHKGSWNVTIAERGTVTSQLFKLMYVMAVRAGDTKRLNADCVKRLSKIKTFFKITCLRIQKCLNLVATFAISSILIDRPCIGTSEFIPWMTRLLIDWLILTLLVVLFAKKCLVMWILLRYIKELTLEKDLSSVHSVENALRKVQLLLGIYERTRPILTNHSSVAIAENDLHVWPIFTYIKEYTLVKSHTNVTNVESVFD